jgi:hypothetical protein
MTRDELRQKIVRVIDAKFPHGIECSDIFADKIMAVIPEEKAACLECIHYKKCNDCTRNRVDRKAEKAVVSNNLCDTCKEICKSTHPRTGCSFYVPVCSCEKPLRLEDSTQDKDGNPIWGEKPINRELPKNTEFGEAR